MTSGGKQILSGDGQPTRMELDRDSLDSGGGTSSLQEEEPMPKVDDEMGVLVFCGMIRSRRHISWNLLRALARQDDKEWVCIGDFNELLSQEEKWGIHDHPHYLIRNFRDVLPDCDLHDIRYTGSLFTWYMKRNSQVVAKQRLDRAVGNGKWFLRFPERSGQSLVALVFDHDPLLLDTSPDSQHTVCRRFCFDNAWLLDANLEAIMVAGWRCEGEVDLLHKKDNCVAELQL
ncbi:hypothetical protein K2173_014264 [Erythroxylum novogranatense]|uniref:Uncharacterized protein n=1 Tax=Erythroxylum novogranatense TaxID=1862640 RepID=A0AAV8SEB4_9ROSI|nr:hypothetical protein K2173_014264 [Erythroxylum novogranatense]